MNKPLFLHIAHVIQQYRTWIEVIDTSRFIEVCVVQDGMLRTLPFQAITLRSYRLQSGIRQTRIWHIAEYDLSQALNALSLQDPKLKRRAERLRLTFDDVERIIEKASSGIIKLQLYDYEY